ncbi:unnamed protein product [Adineta steineri]|uniref:Mitochondria-eating protein n=1 Tax=Adineta steineri TaxID=433720 RepID=A0A818U873_9BILA|nr:unnamed protein product [Adineta steineri]CAF3697396.1 unnamed protein product [Adineta steineri]
MSTKVFLRRLNDMGTFNLLQDKLSRLNDTYLSNSCDTNVSRCIDIIELNARVQRELFKLLNLVSAEGGVYGGATTIRARLLPFVNYEASYFNALLSNTGSDLYPLAWWRYPYAHLRTDTEFEALADEYDRNLSDLELDLRDANVDNARLETELEQTRAELIDERVKSTDEKIYTDAELSNLRLRLSDAEFRLSLERYKPRSTAVDGYEREIRRLRDDIDFAQRRTRARSVSPVLSYIRQRSLTPVRSRSPVRSLSPIRPLISSASIDSLEKIRENTLIQRYNELYGRERLNALDTLRTVSDDYVMNELICFNIVQEAFSVSKRRFAEWKLRLRSQLAITLTGGDSLEDVVQDYVNRNLDYYELTTIVSEVIDNLHRNPRISLPLGVTYSLISTYIREASRVAWHMACLSYPLDIAFASNAEVFDETKYRRSYDSEYAAPLVDHHIWPALMQGARVIVKGEACTKRGASFSRSRATSPTRRCYSSCIRNRSISPVCRSRASSPVTFSSIYRKDKNFRL